MKAKLHAILLTLIVFMVNFNLVSAATVTGRSEDSSLAGTEKIPADSSGTDTYILVSTLWGSQTQTGTVTGTGSAAWDYSAASGIFKTPTGGAIFGGSSNKFTNAISPNSSDGAALGTTSLMWSDLFLASGGVINWNNGVTTLTEASGVLTVAGSGTGDLRVTTAGTNTASVVTVGGTQTLTSKTLTAPVINGATSASGNFDLSGSTGTFKTSTGAATFGGSSHTFASAITPASDGGADLGSASLSWDDLFLDTGATINFDNANVVLTHSSGILTMGTGELRITTAGTNAASVPTLGSTSTLTNKTLTAPVINGATSSGSTALNFGSNTGAFTTSTGANVFSGSSHTFASSITPATDDVGALGSASLQWSDLFLASGALIKFASTDVVLTHSTGILTMGTGELRITTPGTNSASVPTLGSTSTLTNKTLTSPTITGPTITGTTATSGVITQTSASATAFESGLNGGTNPVFRLVNNISSQATGISITGRAAAAGADITVISSGTNEPLTIESKGSGATRINLAATGDVVVGDATNPAFQVVHTTEGTGVKVTSAAAASGVAVAAVSSGTNENLTIDAKGSGTVSIGTSSTGDVIVSNGQVTPQVTAASGDGAITIESGIVVITKGSAAALTLAAPSSQNGKRITIISTTDFAHVITVTGGLWDGTAGSNTTATFSAVKGASCTFVAYGTAWYVESLNAVTPAP